MLKREPVSSKHPVRGPAMFALGRACALSGGWSAGLLKTGRHAAADTAASRTAREWAPPGSGEGDGGASPCGWR